MSGFVSRLDARARNLGDMMQRCGIDPGELARERLGETMIAVARTCMACPHGAACRRWLETADPGKVNPPPAFCPNAQRFRRLRLH